MSYLKSTGQMLKFWLFFLVLPLVGLALLAVVLKGCVGQGVNLSISLILSGLGLSIAGFILGCVTIKCPECGARLLWKAVREQPSDSWYSWLMGLEMCPVCGARSVGRRA
jgi:hypothetical protein